MPLHPPLHDAACNTYLLFFGCRHPQQNYIYQEELEAFARQGVTTLSCAFSRLDGQPKCNVQQKIAKCRDEVWQLLQEGAIVYVCGDARNMELAPLGEVLVDGPRRLTHHQWLTLVRHFAAHLQAYAYEETFVRRGRRQVAHDNEGRTKEPGR